MLSRIDPLKNFCFQNSLRPMLTIENSNIIIVIILLSLSCPNDIALNSTIAMFPSVPNNSRIHPPANASERD